MDDDEFFDAEEMEVEPQDEPLPEPMDISMITMDQDNLIFQSLEKYTPETYKVESYTFGTFTQSNDDLFTQYLSQPFDIQSDIVKTGSYETICLLLDGYNHDLSRMDRADVNGKTKYESLNEFIYLLGQRFSDEDDPFYKKYHSNNRAYQLLVDVCAVMNNSKIRHPTVLIDFLKTHSMSPSWCRRFIHKFLYFDGTEFKGDMFLRYLLFRQLTNIILDLRFMNDIAMWYAPYVQMFSDITKPVYDITMIDVCMPISYTESVLLNQNELGNTMG